MKLHNAVFLLQENKMINNFDTDDNNAAFSALLVYVIYRSRNIQRFKVSTDMWDRITRFVQSSAKRSKTIPDFISKFTKKMDCDAINPRWMSLALNNQRLLQVGDCFIESSGESMRHFMTNEIEKFKSSEIINLFKNNTQWIILLVRDRLEREKVIEGKLLAEAENEQL